MNMEAKMVEFRSGKTYIDNSYMNIPVTDKLIVDFIHEMTSRKNRKRRKRQSIIVRSILQDIIYYKLIVEPLFVTNI